MPARPDPSDVREFVVQKIEHHPRDLVTVVADHFGISRQAGLRHIRRLVDEGVLEQHGATRATQYRLATMWLVDVTLPVAGLQEDVPWRERVAPVLRDLPVNVLQICEHGFTEMLNNVIDHSGSEHVHIDVQSTAREVIITITDLGIGLFRGLCERFHFSTVEEAMLELVKGKLTSDPRRHTGEGIFFSSRIFDRFTITSGDSELRHTEPDDDWNEGDCGVHLDGTSVRMQIARDSPRQLRDVFRRFEDDDFRFSRTHVPVSLVRIGPENLVSRSQARRLLARFEQFDEVVLDFRGVEDIGQAFADEVFRVYQSEHPQLKLIPVNHNRFIAGMIRRVTERSHPTDI
jgi:anti-sigma regulatory factor (Ser/Thr protein kinase)